MHATPVLGSTFRVDFVVMMATPGQEACWESNFLSSL